ncbi:GNAT family N-acetyltransferase [Isoptericola haloaureus]|uniref:GNAT family N-acetyltransferase n=1 Tax=Isoptericola haloaureus TaxID=1542902 RepID=A0ABU7Z9T1_9MICO
MARVVLPPWPPVPPSAGRVELRPVSTRDVAMARELSSDPYVSQNGSLPFRADADAALAWVDRQRARHTEGSGFSCSVVERATGDAVGHCGLWTRDLGEGRASAGYAIVPAARGRGLAADALNALTRFAWTVPGLILVELSVEPWNVASARTAERCGYLFTGRLPRRRVSSGRDRDLHRYVAVRPVRGDEES